MGWRPTGRKRDDALPTGCTCGTPWFARGPDQCRDHARDRGRAGVRSALSEHPGWVGHHGATLLGVVVGLAGHWSWLVLLLTFLLSGHLVTKWRLDEKLSMGMGESSDGHRSWRNVVANGGVPGAVAAITPWWSTFGFSTAESLTYVFAAGVAVAAADTFASEVGCLDRRVRMITTLRRCDPGINGGVSRSGQVAAGLGGGIIAIITGLAMLALGWAPIVGALIGAVSIALIGFLGCQVDSLLGALLENRGWLTKQQVNVLATGSGVLMCVILVLWGWLA